MIKFVDILGLLKEHGWSTYRLQKERVIPNGVIIRIRAGKPITTETVNTICRLCQCQPGDLMSYVEEQE